MDFLEIRRTAITALFADDKLLDELVLKGGNALSLVHGLSRRTSLDIDFSIETDFEDFEESRSRVFRAIKDRFSSVGFVVFDESFERKPSAPHPNQRPWWGGYELKFKLIDKAKYEALGGIPESLRRNALVVGPEQQRKFSVDMSRHEYCVGKLERELDNYTIYVYSPEMIVIEKLRAICQQMAVYERASLRNARARDFYDIYKVVTAIGMDIAQPESIEVMKHIFAAKKVPLPLLAKVRDHREFHRPDWPAVVASVPEKLEEFDFYFDFVIECIAGLEALWVE
jgi:hypothetical protein